MKVYGGTNLEIVAEIQRALSCALLVGQQTTEWGREAVDMAEAAWGTVRHLIPAGHPTLMPYRITLGTTASWPASITDVLKWKATLRCVHFDGQQFIKCLHP